MSFKEEEEKGIKLDWTLKELKKDNCKSLCENVEKQGNKVGHRIPIDCHRLCYHHALYEYYQKYPEKCRERMILEMTRQIENTQSDRNALVKMPIEHLKQGIVSYSYFGLSEFYRTMRHNILKPGDSLENSTIKKCSPETEFAPKGILLDNGDFYVHYKLDSVYHNNYGAHSYDKEICLNGVRISTNEHVRLLQGVKDFRHRNEQVAPFECIMEDDMIYIIHDKTGASGRTGYKKLITLSHVLI